ncbi:MAG TPA: leucine-rich repeat domain-containing protein [Candidatus Nanoarchaeia archaeon]|nr:leucine-rich repeat domain-containing protein [Candidatus Nanoarchaeia archaeon]
MKFGKTKKQDYTNKRDLQELILKDQGLTKLPPEVTQLTELRDLNLEGNQLKDIPTSISQLTKLEELNLMSNRLEYVPRPISQLIQLKKLNLMCNMITSLPDLSSLTELEELNIASNQIKELPTYIGNFNKLKKLDLIGNQIKEIPSEILKKVKENKLKISIAWNPIPKIKSDYNFYISNPLIGIDKTSEFFVLNKEYAYLGSDEFYLQSGLLKHVNELNDELRELIKNYP